MKEQDWTQSQYYQEDFLASHSVQPGSDEARRMTVTSGLKCSELYRKSGPLGSLVRTLLASSVWRSTRCYLTWKASGTHAKRLLFRLVPSMPRTGETAAPLWATPRANDAEKRGNVSADPRNGLPGMVRLWSTPKASDANGTGKPGSKSATHDALRRNLRGEVAMLPTPTTGAGMCGGTGNYQQLKALEAGGELPQRNGGAWLLGMVAS